MRRVRPALLTLLMLLVSVGCKKEEEEKSPQDRYAGDLARAICGPMEACCTANGLTGFDAARCELGGFAFINQGVEGAKKRGATFDNAAAEACIDGTSRQAKVCK